MSLLRWNQPVIHNITPNNGNRRYLVPARRNLERLLGTAPAPNIGFTIWDDGGTFWDIDTRTGEPATTWDRKR
jgi:hypothetical protein